MQNILRTLLGAALSLVLVGEITVGASSGLFQPGGIVTFGALYITFFMVIDALVSGRKCSNAQLVLISFALYSVLITGLLHGELMNYALHPQDNLITTLIRIQSSLFLLFVYPILHRVFPAGKPLVSVRTSLLLLTGLVLVLTPSQQFGLYDMVRMFQVAPAVAVGVSCVALLALWFGTRIGPARAAFQSRSLLVWSAILCALGLIPGIVPFMILLVAMMGVSGYYLARAGFRWAEV